MPKCSSVIDRESQLTRRIGIVAAVCLGVFLGAGSPVFADPPARTLIVRGDHAYPPYESLDREGRPIGFNVDLFQAVADAAGLRYELRLGPWAVVRDELERGRIDVLLGMYRSAKRDAEVDFTAPYLVSSHAIFVRRGSDIHHEEDLAGRSVIVQASDAAHDVLRERQVAARVVLVDTPDEALRLLAAGQHDCAVISKLHGAYLTRKLGLRDIHAVGDPIINLDYCFAVREGDAALKAKLDEGLRIVLADGRYQKIYERWFSAQQHQAEWALLGRYLLMILTPVGLGLIVIIVWNTTLKRRVRVKTRELAGELAERREAEAALRRERDFSDTILSTVDALVTVLDSNGCVVSFNRACEVCTGYAFEEIRGRKLWDLLLVPEETAEVQKVFRRLFTENEPRRYVNGWRTRDGRRRLIEWSNTVLYDSAGAADYIISAGIDVTERREAESEARRLLERLHHAQKLEAVGQLAGGVAHDFNNLLTVILGNVEFLSEWGSENEDVQSLVRGIRDAATQAAGVTRSLLTFSHRLPTEKQVLDLRAAVREAVKLVHRLLPAAIELQTDFGDGTPLLINGDPAQIQQVVLNLVINARDAMPEGGLLRVAVSQGLHQADGVIDVPDDHVVLTVADSGEGIPKEAQARIFEPFFTTKDRSRGTGLGLAITHSAVAEHGGAIQVCSECGVGTTFFVMLPCATETMPLTPDGTIDRSIAHSAGGRILLAEDDTAARELLGRVLEEAGYVVIYAPDGPALLEAYRENRADLQLIVTDVDLPGRSGISCLWEIRAAGDLTPVIIITGGVDPSVDRALGPSTVLMRKPFSMAQLGREVNRLVQTPAAANSSPSP